MADCQSILPSGEKLRRTIRWISETVLEQPEKPRREILKEAEVRFDLSPKECQFLDTNFAELIDCQRRLS